MHFLILRKVECFLENVTKKILTKNSIKNILKFIFSVRPSLEPGWLEGNLDGRRGLVPENYVEYIS